MKKIFLLPVIYQVILLTTLISCGPSKEEIDAMEKKRADSINAVTQQMLLSQPADNSISESTSIPAVTTKTYNPISDFYIGIYKVRGCEYITWGQGKGCCAVLHAGDCDNPIHEQQKTDHHADFPIN